jgi:hypothetical protein
LFAVRPFRALIALILFASLHFQGFLWIMSRSFRANTFVIESDLIKNGASYSIYTGGSSTGTLKDGLYSGGLYSGGALKKTFTISSRITNVTF